MLKHLNQRLLIVEGQTRGRSTEKNGGKQPKTVKTGAKTDSGTTKEGWGKAGTKQPGPQQGERPAKQGGWPAFWSGAYLPLF